MYSTRVPLDEDMFAASFALASNFCCAPEHPKSVATASMVARRPLTVDIDDL
jgi:hypothetical protein